MMFVKFPTSKSTTDKRKGYFGIAIRDTSNPVQTQERAVFITESSSPGSLFFVPSGNISDTENRQVVFLRNANGELDYAVQAPGLPFIIHTDVFDTTYFAPPASTALPALDIQLPSREYGLFLACPRKLGEKREKGYGIYAMTPAFKYGGCITLDYLAQKDVEEKEQLPPRPTGPGHDELKRARS